MTTGSIIDVRIWGKARGLCAPYPLIWHLIDAAAAARCLWEDYLADNQRSTIASGLGLPDGEARKLVALLAGLHDIGKCMACFQHKHRDSFDRLLSDGFEDARVDGGLGHARASQLVAYPVLYSMGFGKGMPAASPAYRCAQVLGGHHGRFQLDLSLDYLRDPLVRVAELGGDGWIKQRESMVDAVRQAVGATAVPVSSDPPALALVTGIVILADWLVSQERFLRARQVTAGTDVSSAGVAAHYAATAAMVPSLLAEAGLGRSGLRGGRFEEVFAFSANAMQRSIAEELLPAITGPGLLVATAATGEGKTEAALYAAQVLARVSGSAGCFVALPTMATANEMYLRLHRYLDRQALDDTSLTLLHSMAWLNPQYAQRLPPLDGASVVSDVERQDGVPAVAATDWLRGSKRGLLADWATGTVDQALLAVLPLPHTTLRLLGLSRKVLVVDEAHAYDPYMQFLLRRLLTWCGRLGCSVVLLSATLPSSIARSLIEAYCRGAKRSVAPMQPDAVPYPGWVFVPADGSVPMRRPSAAAATAMATPRPHGLTVRMVAVRHHQSADPPRAGERLTAIREVLTPIGAMGGCAAVVCNTVQDAQRTYQDLAGWAQTQPCRPEVDLLHARFPAYQREQTTASITTRFGKDAGDRRPPASIVVATQVIEQSLDLDFDLLVSDLAPMALLLQRAGRCWRHPGTRRPIGMNGPCLVVLDPVGPTGAHARPPHWGEVYGRFLLRRTQEVLTAAAGKPIAVPGDVQDLVERVYCPTAPGEISFLSDDEPLLREWEELEGTRLAHESLAALVAVKEPDMLADLRALSHAELTEAKVATRLGTDSRRLVCCYVRDDGSRWLDPEAVTTPLPEHPTKRPFDPSELATIMRHSVPVRETEVVGTGPAHQPPASWQDHFLLRDLLLLPHTPADDAPPRPLGDLPLHLDLRLGLRKRTDA